MFWLIKNSHEVLDKLKTEGVLASSLFTYDFSTLYTALPHNLIKGKLIDQLNSILIESALFIWLVIRNTHVSLLDNQIDIIYGCNRVCDALLICWTIY